MAKNNQIHLVRFCSMNNLLRRVAHRDRRLNLHVLFLSTLPYSFEALLEVFPRIIKHRFQLNLSCRLGRTGDSENKNFRIGTMR